MAAKKQSITWTNERRKLSDLIPWERNPRTINNAQAERLVDSVETFGQVETLAIDCRNGVLNGHQRLNVLAGQYGMDYEVDVRVANRVLTERERQQLTVYLHKGAAGDWVPESLFENFDFSDLTAWGFDSDELEAMFADMQPEPTSAGADTEAQIDKAEELRVKWNVSSGQLWALGEHRLICGDCTDPAVVARVMGGEKSAICFTSPPYNAGRTPTEQKSDRQSKYTDDDDSKDDNDYFSLLNGFTNCALDVCEYVFVNIQSLSGNKRTFLRYWYQYIDRFADVAIWDKQNAQPAMAHRVMDSRFEFVLIFSHAATRAIGTRDFRGMVHNVYTGSPQRNNEFSGSHTATFPLDLPVHFIESFTNKDDSIYEPFSGTGTTLIACQNLGRKCRAVEISEGYVAVAIERFYQHTSIEPVLISN